MPTDAEPALFWLLITRLGEAQILLPMALAVSLWLARRRHAWPLVPWWLLLLGGAAGITLATKLAFIGWGIGSAAFDFTGISGHAMFAAAVLPPLLGLTASRAPRPVRLLAWGAGGVLAAVVALSRLVIGVHSPSEVVAGFVLGLLVSAVVLTAAQGRRTLPSAPLGLPALLLLWVTRTPAAAPPLNTHGLVTRMALSLSGRDEPFTRAELLAPREQ